MKNKKSMDTYGFNTDIIKTIKNVLILPLTKLINLCINENTFPQVLKIAEVTPIHKKGSTDDINNYRPISILPVISKIYETILKNQLVDHFERNLIFYDKQFGSRSGKSTSEAVNLFIEMVVAGFENGIKTSHLPFNE